MEDTPPLRGGGLFFLLGFLCVHGFFLLAFKRFWAAHVRLYGGSARYAMRRSRFLTFSVEFLTQTIES
jgi:hypothetical protein